MRIVKPSRYYLWILPIALLALAGLVWNRPKSVSAKGHFDLDDVHGRYVSAEYGYDISDASVPALGGIPAPIYYASASVLQADGKGNLCGENDGFYGLTGGPESNTGPSFYHGQYTVDANGRIAITTCSDANTVTGICQDNSTCPASAEGNSTRLQVGYIQGDDGNTIVTVAQFLSGFPDSTGFNVHQHTWTKAPRRQSDEDRDHGDHGDH